MIFVAFWRLPVVLEIEMETFLLVIVYLIVYCIPGPLDFFIDDFILSINELPAQHRILAVVILILIKCCLSMLPKLIFWFKIWTCLSIHNIQLIYGEILDLVFDTSNSNIVSSLPSLYSDHFVRFLQIWCNISIQNLVVNNLVFNHHHIILVMISWLRLAKICWNNQESNVTYGF